MSTATPVEKIRAAITQQLQSLGVTDTDGLYETILIRDGLFCGRKYQCSGYEIVWFIEEDELKFFSPCGDLLVATSAIALAQASAEEETTEVNFSQPVTATRRPNAA